MEELFGKKQICFLCGMGFLAGVLYMGVFGRKYVGEEYFPTVFFARGYSPKMYQTRAYLWYLLKLRLLPICALVLVGHRKIQRILVPLLILWTGFLSGAMLVLFVTSLKAGGILFWIAGAMPHALCYLLVYVVLLWHYVQSPQASWNGSKTAFVCLMFFLGIAGEIYLNPLLMERVCRWIS